MIMNKPTFVLLILAAMFGWAAAQDKLAAPSEDFGVIRVDARPEKGFAYPYFLYVPPALRESSAGDSIRTMLVIPNNSGRLDDDFSVHEADAKRRIIANSRAVGTLNTVILLPVFPRPKSDWQTYVHALDRDTMLAGTKQYARPDLQLIAMIDDARKKLKGEGLKTDKKVLVLGFSASGMFTNRFTFLHPGRVKAAVIGSPGGWPIAPVSTYKEKALRYPIGTSDLKLVAGKALDLDRLRKVPLFIFLGNKDENDSVPFSDSYDDEDRDLIFPLLGKKPVDRWEISKEMYRSAGLEAEFRLYPNIGHSVEEPIRADIVAFLAKHAK